MKYLQVASSHENRLNGAHAVVVMMLRGQLLRTQSISCDDLHRQRTGVDEAARVQTYLGDHCIVRYHHSHRTEQSL